MGKRVYGVAILLVAATMVLGGAVTRAWWTEAPHRASWWTRHDGRLEPARDEMPRNVAGLLTAPGCFERGCPTQVVFDEMLDGRTPRAQAYALTGRIAFFGAFVLFGLALVVVLRAFTRPEDVAPAGRAAVVVAQVVLGAATVFVFLHEEGPDVSIGYSLALYMFGAPAAAIGAMFLSPPGRLQRWRSARWVSRS